jgi:hypothetical protein
MRQLAVEVVRSSEKESAGQLAFKCAEFPKGRQAQYFFDDGWTLNLANKLVLEGRYEYYLLEKDSLLSSPFRSNFEAREKLKKGEKRNVWKRAESSLPSHVRV